MATPATQPPVAQPAAKTARVMRRALRVLGILVLILAGLAVLVVIGLDTGLVAFAIGLVAATIPVPIYLALAMKIDRFEPEPLRLMAWAFFWGASASTAIALLLNTAGEALVGSQFGKHVGEIYGGSVSAPIVEETAKAAVLFAIYRWRRTEFNGIVDGIVYAAMVGLGFAMTENVLYYSHAAAHGGVPLAATFFARGVLSPFTHPFFTSMTGIGLGIAIETDKRWLKIVAPPAGLVSAMLLHSIWNTSASGGVFLGAYFLLMVPIFLLLITLAIWANRREGMIVRRLLAPEVADGILTRGELYELSSISDRALAIRRAGRRRTAHRRLYEQFAMTASELAFLRCRVERGLESSDTAATQEPVYVKRLRELRERLGPEERPAPTTIAASVVATPGVAQPAAGPGGPNLAGAQPPAPPAPAAWYGDPFRRSRLRWWDGTAWTVHTWE